MRAAALVGATALALAGACNSTKTDPGPQPKLATTERAGATPPSAKAPPMTPSETMLEPPTRITAAFGLRDLRRDQLLALLQVAPTAVVDHVAYEKLTDVSRVSNPAVFGAHVFLRGDEVVMIYSSSAAYLAKLSPASIQQELGGSGTRLRSRAGKTSNQHVFPEQGVAYSESDDQLEFIEIFPPMSLDAYRASIYSDPGPFIR